jgi:hypothetical protein
MNIFVLHPNPKKAARFHADKHVVKMILESVQMLYTAHWVFCYSFLADCKSPIELSKTQKTLKTPPQMRFCKAPYQKNGLERGYRPVHVNHPCTKWVRESISNYMWLCDLAIALAKEHQYRYPDSKSHSCEEHALWLKLNPPPLPKKPLLHFALAMPDEYKKNDAIQSYRAFYKGSKTERGITSSYTRRHRPHWL